MFNTSDKSAFDPVKFLRELVSIKSLSGAEGEAVEFLVAQMWRLGFDSAFADEAGNAIGIRANQDSSAVQRDIILLGHIDTVPGAIPVRIDNELLYGRGSVDAKGALAAFVVAASEVTLPAGVRLIVIGAVEEESSSSKGARWAATQYAPQLCIIGEPSGWNGVTIGYKGNLLIDYALQRDTGHASGMQSNVAESAIEWWNKISDLISRFNSEREQLFDQLIPSIRAFNTDSDGMTDSAKMKIGIRLPPGFPIDSTVREFCTWGGDARITVDSMDPAYQSSRTSPLARAFNVAIRAQSTGVHFKRKTGTSDMNIVGPIWRCPIVAYGPGDSRLDHTPNEHVPIADYLKSIAILRDVLQML
jgi:LysW-gamma-L-lysine carboxypeptidase